MSTLSWFPMPVYVDKVLGEAKEKIEEDFMLYMIKQSLLRILNGHKIQTN